VPREHFLPDLAPADVYRDDAVVTRRDAAGLPTSSSSQPSIMAIMIEQAGLRPGDRVLEVGAGTGYNAAVMREVVGPQGRVVTLDIQPDVAREAEAHLRAAGYGDVVVAAADGGYGYADGAPYDCIMVTASVSDVSPHWRAQLREGGVLVLPLRVRTQGLSVAFERRGAVLVSRSTAGSGFMHLRGAFGHGDALVEMGDGLFLSGPHAPEVPLHLLAALLAGRPRVVGSLIVPVNSFGLGGGLGVYLALEEPGVVDVFTSQPERWGFHSLSGVIDVAEGSLCLSARMPWWCTGRTRPPSGWRSMLGSGSRWGGRGSSASIWRSTPRGRRPRSPGNDPRGDGSSAGGGATSSCGVEGRAYGGRGR
jgi:protein-L-isoaspartate(D-aspartate) O-methyltransferase